MARGRTNPKVDAFLRRAKPWQQELAKLRAIILDCGLTEEFKWMHPCYCFENRNVVLIHGFKRYCAILFVKGALLKDIRGILIQQTENVQAGRHIRFTHVREIAEREPVLKAYIREAIAVEKSGLKVNLKKTSDFKIPEEFQNKLDAMPALKTAFKALTPGRQRAYLLHFSGAKQSQTRASRVEKYVPQILKGKGLDDDYLSKRKQIKQPPRRVSIGALRPQQGRDHRRPASAGSLATEGGRDDPPCFPMVAQCCCTTSTLAKRQLRPTVRRTIRSA